MTRMFTITAAAIAFAATGAVADTQMSNSRSEMHNNSAMNAMSTDELANSSGDLIRSRDITGGVIYTMNEASDEGWDASATWDEVDSDWNQIGEIEDLVLTSEGMVSGIVAEVGGFLDIGDKHVVISVQDLSLVAVDDQTYAYVTKLNEEDLESMNGVDEGFWN
ncbi:PRC-barrel domain-containing protein [Hoeflea sp.]|uniref:PRC-barrel domain-containing protein n=1 Tax=Hoeflea sp. TaxID=1940281 RepID=UPI003B52A877